MSRLDPRATAESWQKSGLKLTDLNIDATDDRFAFLAQHLVNGVEAVSNEDELDQLIAQRDVESIFTYIEKNYEAVNKSVLRSVTQKIMRACIKGRRAGMSSR